MPIRRVSVSNFKSISEIDVELSMFNVVIGSNAAGKSNFISVFRFLRDIARNGLVNAIAMQEGAEYLRNTTIGPSRDLAIRVVYEPKPQLEVLERQVQGSPQAGVRSSVSSYEFALRFHNGDDGFTITKDQLVIGCEVIELRGEGRRPSRTHG
jgi:predicted ATPase